MEEQITISDKQISRITDSIIIELKKQFRPDEVTIVGGTTNFSDEDLSEEKIAEIPILMVNGTAKNDLKRDLYYCKNSKSDMVEHAFTNDALSMEYDCFIALTGGGYEKCNNILDTIKDYFQYSSDMNQGGIFLTIDDVKYQNELFSLPLSIAEIVMQETNIFSIALKPIPFVYYVSDNYDRGEIAKNPQLQKSLTLVALKYISFHEFINKHALNELENKYKYLFENKLFSNSKNDKLFLELKKSYKKGENVDKNEFDSVFNKLTKYWVCPDLYEKTANKIPYDDIFKELTTKSDDYKHKFLWICDLLRIPEKVKSENKVHELCNRQFFDFCISNWHDDIHLDRMSAIDEFISVYVKKLDDDNESSTDIVVSNVTDDSLENERTNNNTTKAAKVGKVLKTTGKVAAVAGLAFAAMGLASAAVSSKYSNNNNEKVDLLGSAGCAKNRGGSCLICKLKWDCTRG